MSRVGSFSDLYARVNNLLDRKIDGVNIINLFKVFPDATKESTLNLNYNHKTSTGQKFKFSTTSKRDLSKAGKSAYKTTGKLAAEPLFADAETGTELNVAIAKKDDRDTIEVTEKYKKIDNVTIAVTAKVDKHQSLGAKASYDDDKVSGSLELTRAFDWKLFSKFQTKTPAELKGQTDLSIEGLANVDGDKKWYLGGAGNFLYKDSHFSVSNFTVATSYKALDFQATGLVRVNWEKAREIAVALNLFWEVEKDVQFAGEAVVKPRAATTDELFDYAVATSFPFSSGTATARFGLDGFLGTSFTQSLNKQTKLAIGASYDTLDLSNSAYSISLTFDA